VSRATLRDAGQRFVYRGGRYLWAHPASVEAGDIDLTEMDDNQFEAFVRSRTAGRVE